MQQLRSDLQRPSPGSQWLLSCSGHPWGKGWTESWAGIKDRIQQGTHNKDPAWPTECILDRLSAYPFLHLIHKGGRRQTGAVESEINGRHLLREPQHSEKKEHMRMDPQSWNKHVSQYRQSPWKGITAIRIQSLLVLIKTESWKQAWPIDTNLWVQSCHIITTQMTHI